MKKIIALVLALAMIMMVGAVYADDNSNLGAPFDGDTHSDTTFKGEADGTISLSNLEDGDKVQFYQVLAFDQNAKREDLGTKQQAAGWAVTSKFTEAVSASDLKDILTIGISSELAGKIGLKATGTPTKEATAADGVASTAAEPGLYVAIVIPANAGWMFNPVFVANDYYKTGDVSNSSTWSVEKTPLSYSDRAMAKKAPIGVDKEAHEHEEATGETHDAKAVAKGDTIDFKVTTTIPEFADNYTAPIFNVSDVMTSGLSINSAIKVYIGDNELTAKYTDDDGVEQTRFTITPENPTTQYTVKFNSGYLLSLDEATTINIRYSAEVTENAVENVHEEDNTVTVEYSHEPSVTQDGQGKKVRDKTHHYTFTIDGDIWGDSGRKLTETVKIGLDKNGNEIKDTVILENTHSVGALAGAKFKLYRDAEGKNPVNTTEYVSGTDGRIQISGLDAGIYYLIETQAPAGYIRQQSAVKIEIIPDYFPEFSWVEDGLTVKSNDVLKSYTVKIDDHETASYTINYDFEVGSSTPKNDIAKQDTNGMKTTEGDIVVGNSGPIDVENYEAEDEYGKIKNTQGTELPSTGGIGTTIFYILGGLLVIGAAVILVARRKAQD